MFYMGFNVRRLASYSKRLKWVFYYPENGILDQTLLLTVRDYRPQARTVYYMQQ